MARLRIQLGSDGSPAGAAVALSRRNLLTLLHKLDMTGSARVLFNTDVEIDGDYAPGFTFGIRAEEDAEHYAQRPDPPGQMHSQSESFIRARGGWSKREG